MILAIGIGIPFQQPVQPSLPPGIYENPDGTQYYVNADGSIIYVQP